jgi:PST family polysaccharide transporter
LAPVLAWLYGEPVLLEITPAVALAFIFTGMSVQHLSLLRRQMQFGTVAAVQLAAEVIAISTSNVAALMGYGLWSLVIQRIVWAVVTAAGAWFACGWHPGLPGRYSDVRSFVSFGANATGAMTIGYLAANLDKVLIGWYWGATILGFYDRAQKIAQLPIQNLNAPLANVALAALSRVIDQPARYRSAYITTVERLNLLMVPIGVIFIAAGDLAVRVVLGSQWTDTAPVLAWMGVSLLYMPITYSLSWLYMSQDRTPEMLQAGLVNAGLILAALVAGLPFGANGVAAAYALSGAFVRGPILFWMVARRGPISLGHLAPMVILPACSAAGAVGCILALRAWEPFTHLSPIMAFAAAVVVGGCATLIIYMLMPRGRRILVDAMRLPGLLFGRKANA